MTVATLVTGGSARQREAAIAAAMQAGAERDASTALILEGLPDGVSSIDPANFPCIVAAVRLAPGCPCCSGNLVLRVTLNRILRQRPVRLYYGLATTVHLAQVRHFLTQPPYRELLVLGADLAIQDLPSPRR